VVQLFQYYFNSIEMYSNTKVIVTQSVMTHHCIIIIVSNKSTTNLPKLTNLPKYMIKFQNQKKLFRYIIRKAISAFAQNNGPSAEQ